MALPDLLLYLSAAGVLMLATMIFPVSHLEKSFIRASSILWSWIEAKENEKISENTTKIGPTYPPEWLTDEKNYDLECRAIFSKQWQYVTHTSMFQKAGDYRTFIIANISFIVILGKDKKVRAFHNVCRHRAYAVTKKECGSSIVLGCRYHGWSYDTRGKLIKAPEFESIPGFDKEMNGLWELQLEIQESMVFVKFDSSSDEALKLDKRLLKSWKLSEMKCIADWKVDGAFNWKLLGALKESKSDKQSWLPSWFVTSTHDVDLFQTTLVRRLASGKVLVIKAIPKSAKATTLDCSILANGTIVSAIEVKEMKKSLSRDMQQLAAIQRRFTHNQESMSALTCNIAKQDEINRILKGHLLSEKKLGVEIHPAARIQHFTQEGKEDDDCEFTYPPEHAGHMKFDNAISDPYSLS